MPCSMAKKEKTNKSQRGKLRYDFHENKMNYKQKEKRNKTESGEN